MGSLYAIPWRFLFYGYFCQFSGLPHAAVGNLVRTQKTKRYLGPIDPAVMMSILTSAARQLKRPVIPPRPFIAASASVASSSRLYASKSKKPTNAPAIEVSHTSAPPSGQAKALREPLGSATLAGK